VSWRFFNVKSNSTLSLTPLSGVQLDFKLSAWWHTKGTKKVSLYLSWNESVVVVNFYIEHNFFKWNSLRMISRMTLLVRGVLRLCFVVVNNIYTIPTYVVWMALLSPLRCCTPDLYWRIEGIFFHWLLAMVSLWSWSAGYDSKCYGNCLDYLLNLY